MATFSELFHAILTADKESSRRAARQVRKLVYASGGPDKYDQITSIVENAPGEYERMQDDFRQENFVSAISVMYFLHRRKDHPDFLFPWLLGLLRHANGYIRHAAVRMISIELGPLTRHIRLPGEVREDALSPVLADAILLKLYADLHDLLSESFRPEYRRYRYVSSLPSGTYKSVQMILGCMEEDCGERYLSQLANALHPGRPGRWRSRQRA